MHRKAKTGPPVLRKSGKRMEVYVRPRALVQEIERLCRVRNEGRQAVLLNLLEAGLQTLNGGTHAPA